MIKSKKELINQTIKSKDVGIAVDNDSLDNVILFGGDVDGRIYLTLKSTKWLYKNLGNVLKVNL